MTSGIDHVGLSVSDVRASAAFFTDCLGWTVFGEKPDYPAIFVTDGAAKLTLWQVATDEPNGFDRNRNVGLHHLALKAGSREALDALFAKVVQWPGVEVEFAPELSGKGPKVHAMIREPGGCRLEFAWDPRGAQANFVAS